MIKMSFYDGTMDREKLKEFIEGTSKPIRYTYGFASRNPTTYKELITKENALKIVESEGYLDANENKEFLHLNAYSDNDMY